MPIFELFSALFFAFVFVLFTIPAVIRLAEQRRWLDNPGKLKHHLYPVTKLGGFSIFGGVLFSVLLFVDASLFHEFKYSLAGFVILFLAGFLDDIKSLPPWQKFVFQTLAAMIIVLPGKVLLSSFYGFLGVYELSWGYSVLVSVFLLVGITNAFNTIDGVDLLATLHGFWVTMFLAIWLVLSLQFNAALISIAICGALAAFIYFNAPPARIFLGDSGTMPIGMAIAMLLLKSVNVAGVYTGIYALENAPVLAFSLLAIPLFDLGRLSILRLLNGHSPFHGDRNHLHHVLQDRGWSHARISYTLNLSGIGIFLIVLLLNSWIENINLLMAIVMMLTAGVFAVLLFAKGEKHGQSLAASKI